MKFITRFLQPSNQSFFLFGPRGTGKSTWLRQYYPHALWIDLLEPETVRAYSARPERLKEAVLAANKKHIIIDEIQKIPELLSIVHSLIERKQGWQFILTGSSARKLKRGGVNLLAGRAVIRRLHPFMAAELGDNFDLNRALQFGLLPLVVADAVPEDVLRAYIGLYMDEEVKAESLVRNIGHFARFLEIISFSHGSTLNINNIARECEVSRKLIQGYVSILEDLLLSFTLPVFTKRAKRATVSHSKFYYFDAGVYRSLRPHGPLDKPEEISGTILEGLVVQHLRAWNDYSGLQHSISYWRTRGGSEVDIIVYGPTNFWAIEIKSSSIINSADLRSLRTFAEDYPESSLLFLYRGKEKLQKNNIICAPVDKFLRNLHPTKTIKETIDSF